ncbi:hypothetical protein ACNRWW_07445 [Metabacillus sp. HB246100]|uniref:hypothetical protein n=1 Tax=Bacillus weihaiensis TaxID=1547283 RepID=UPI0023573B81|nr:hypothetical protein [Bacillus weihaiensis]
MKIAKLILLVLFCSVILLFSVSASASPMIKVVTIESNEIVAEAPSSSFFDQEVRKAIRTIDGITVEANPLPNKGYILKIPLKAPVKIKNKWYEDIVQEVLIIYNSSDTKRHRIVLYTDENTPMFFNTTYDVITLLQKMGISE